MKLRNAFVPLLCATCALARADVVVLVDASASSPAMGPGADAYVLNAAQHVPALLMKQTLGSRLMVIQVGEHDKPGGKLLDKTIQRFASGAGDTSAAYAKDFPRFLAAQVARRRLESADRQSHLTAAVVTARRLIDPDRGECAIVMLSDLAEWDQAGIQYPRDWKLPLPGYPGFDLKGCRFLAFGAGQGIAPRASEAVIAHWQAWLARYGASGALLEKF